MLEVSLRIELPAVLDVSRNDLRGSQRLDEIESLDPGLERTMLSVEVADIFLLEFQTCLVNLRRLDLFNPHVCRARIHRISANYGLFGGKPEQTVKVSSVPKQKLTQVSSRVSRIRAHSLDLAKGKGSLL